MSFRRIALFLAAPALASGFLVLGAPDAKAAIPCTVTSNGYGVGVGTHPLGPGARICFTVLGFPGHVETGMSASVPVIGPNLGSSFEQEVQVPGGGTVNMREYAATSPAVEGFSAGPGGVTADPQGPYQWCFQSSCTTGDLTPVAPMAVTQSVVSVPAVGSSGGMCTPGACVDGRLATQWGNVTVQPGIATGPVTGSPPVGAHCVVAFDGGPCSL
jgi:hypothetical protein